MYKFFLCQQQMFFDSELEIYYDHLKNDQILLHTVNFYNGKKKYILLNKQQCTQTWNFKFVINKLKFFFF
jgi:hypothetical protein